MRHAFNASAYGFRLRPVELDDAEFIISLRADPVHARFLNPTSRSVPEQHAYLRKLFDRPGDFSFVLEHAASRRPEGLVAICDVTESPAQAKWTDAGAVDHVFTHFALTMTLSCARVDARPEGLWWPIARIGEAGLPTLFARLAERGLAWREAAAQAA